MTDTAKIPYPWREPDAETEDYPNLWVHDGRVTGSITVGQSRLPLWAIIGTAVTEDWQEVEDGWSPDEHYGFDANDLANFLNDLLQARGEFGRLLLTLANAERVEHEAEIEILDRYADEDGISMVKIYPETDPDAVPMPPPWWAGGPEANAVYEQLRRCLEVLEPVCTVSATAADTEE